MYTEELSTTPEKEEDGKKKFPRGINDIYRGIVNNFCTGFGLYNLWSGHICFNPETARYYVVPPLNVHYDTMKGIVTKYTLTRLEL